MAFARKRSGRYNLTGYKSEVSNRISITLSKPVGDKLTEEAHEKGYGKAVYVAMFVEKAYRSAVFLPEDLVARVDSLSRRTGRTKQEIAIAAIRSGLGLMERGY